VSHGPATAGAQFRVVPGPWPAPGPAYRAADALLLESFDDLAPYLGNRGDKTHVTIINQGEGGGTLPGVTQIFESTEADPKEGARCAVYTAESGLSEANGWSVVTKVFEPPLDLAWHQAIGLWMRGDGNGGAFKVQLTDGKAATDYYIPNDYSGWRYQQLPRPAKDPMDYACVRTLSFYYNGLPAKTRVACGIDDVKALRALDAPTITDPWVELDGQRLAWQGTLAEGQSLFLWPGEPWRLYAPGKEVVVGPAPSEAICLADGEHQVKFGCAEPVFASPEVRVTLQPAEQYALEP